MAVLIPPERWLDVARECGYFWKDFDLDTFRCPADTIGVIIMQQMVSTTVARNTFGVRKNGSTDTGLRMYQVSQATGPDAYTWHLRIVGCDANHIIEMYLGNERTPLDKIWLVGWLVTGDGALFDNVQLPGDAAWRAAWTNATTFVEVNMDSVKPGSGPPSAYIVNLYNSYWATGNLVAVPAGQTSTPQAARDNVRIFDNLGSSMPVSTGTNGNLALCALDPSTDVEMQVVGYLLPGSGWASVGAMSSLMPTPGGAGGVFTGYDLDTYATLPANTIAYFAQARATTSGSITGIRESTPRTSTLQCGYYANGHTWLNINSPGNTYDASGKWDSMLLFGVITSSSPQPIPPAYSPKNSFKGDAVNENLATGWTNASPTGYTVNQLPAGLTMANTGMVTGTPTTVGSTAVTVSNSSGTGVGSSVMRPQGALFYDEFYQYDASQSIEGTTLAATYGAWQKSRNSSYNSHSLPDLVGQAVQRASGQSLSLVAGTYLPPLNFCIAFTLAADWYNGGVANCSVALMCRHSTSAATTYQLRLYPSSVATSDLQLWRFIAGSKTTLVTVTKGTVGYLAGGRFRWELNGLVHKVWYKPLGGAESQIISYNDTGGGTAPGATAGENIIFWDQVSGTQLYPISDYGVWPAGGFVEYTPALVKGAPGASPSVPAPIPMADGSFTWAIINKPVAPTYAAQYNPKGAAVSVNMATGWTNANASGFSSTNLPAGLTVNSAGLVTGTPTTVETRSSVIHNATAAGTVSSAPFNWQIFLGGIAPDYPDMKSYLGTAVSQNLAAGWTDANPTGFVADQLPPGLSMASNGTVTGTPTTLGTTTVTVRNGTPPTASYAAPFDWQIIAKGVPPTYAPRQNVLGSVVNVNLATGWTGAGANGFTASGLPAGLTMSATGVVTGVPNTVQVVFTTVSNDAGAGPVPATAFRWSIDAQVTAPDYADKVNYVGDVVNTDLSAGWST